MLEIPVLAHSSRAALTRPDREPPSRCVPLLSAEQTFGIHQQMALATSDLLASIVSARLAAHPGRPGGLRASDASTRLKLLTREHPQLLSQGGVEPF